jgi:sulfatase modifying factor 1
MRVLAVVVVAAAACGEVRLDESDAVAPDVLDAGLDAGLDADTSVDAATDAAPDAAACSDGARACRGDTAIECQGGAWIDRHACPALCDHGGCVTPPSCRGGQATCGPAGTTSCCRSLAVPGGTFARSHDDVTPAYADDRYRASVSGFHLDTYEVTVARIRGFVEAYPASRPADGAGANPDDAADVGWRAAWSALLPPTADELSAQLACDGTSPASTEPARCVSWYVAQAFCIWDGGRLPTEAEWNYAAAGGEQQRAYPWSTPPTSTAIDRDRAGHDGAAITPPGVRPAGDGRWGHADLAGNAAEWVLDSHAAPYPTDLCTDCANHAAAPFRVVRGGSLASGPSALLASARSSLDPTVRRATTGFRCARDPDR